MTKRKKEGKSALSEHRHCPICGISISIDKQFCGKECEKEFEKASRKRKMQLIALLAVYGLVFLLLFVLPRLLT